MKGLIPALLIAVAGFGQAAAAPGDTTQIQAHYDVEFKKFGDHDTTVVFPDGSSSYRNIYMTFTLGKYQCPPPVGPPPHYCGDWDYTVQIFILTKTGDSLELGRLITPYANAGSPRTPWSWKQRYIFDVTDFSSLLQDTATVRVHYSGYSWGFTGNLKFAFVEGTPARNVLGISDIYGGGFSYGDPGNPIEAKLPAVSLTAPAGTNASELKFTITGHGADGTGCSEFCSKYYQVLLNGNQVAQTNIWRADCGRNHLYPQSGTWVYDRGNWCPGDQVQVNSHVLPGISGGGNFSVDVDLEPYTKVGTGSPSYIIEAAVFHYGAMNKMVDADLLDIVAPNRFETYFRENPRCGKPVVKVKNTGSSTITTLKLEYGIDINNMSSFNWTGSLASMRDTLIELPELSSLNMAAGDTATQYFTVRIAEVNTQADADLTNNQLTVPFKATQKWPTKLIVRMVTNSATDIGGNSETSWKIMDLSGNIVAQRVNNAPSTTFIDTVSVGPGCYKLVVDDLGCDGLYWWANPGAGSGSVSVRPTTSLLGFKLDGYFSADFGCGFTQYFYSDWPTSVEDVDFQSGAIEAFPNPAQQTVTVTISGRSQINGQLQIVDAMGRVVQEHQANKASQELKISGLASGAYHIIYTGKDGKLQTRLLITK